jgi:hypothetical protein
VGARTAGAASYAAGWIASLTLAMTRTDSLQLTAPFSASAGNAVGEADRIGCGKESATPGISAPDARPVSGPVTPARRRAR